MTTPSELYRFQALLLPWGVSGLHDLYTVTGSAWHDGDTFNALVDQGMRGYSMFHIRCGGYNAPEINKLATRVAGTAARDYAASLVDTGQVVLLNSVAFAAADEEDDFGRMLAYVTLPDGRDLSELMITSGNAVPYP